MFMFDPALAPLVIYLVTAGIKSVFGSISGRASMVVASLVAALLLFGESVISGLGPDGAAIATSAIELLLLIAGAYGLHDVVKTELGKRV